MALAYLPDEATYLRKARALIDQCDTVFEATCGATWEEALDRYSWADRSWRETESLRQEHSKQLRSALENKRFRSAVDEITDWGRVPRFDKTELRSLAEGIRALPLLDAGGITPGSFYSARVASTSKVYASMDLNKWVTYDSRVARALALMIRKLEALDDRYLRLPQPPDRGHERQVEGFPALASKTSMQASLAFLYSSWLCRAMADRLNSRSKSRRTGRWTALRVEMALFEAGA